MKKVILATAIASTFAASAMASDISSHFGQIRPLGEPAPQESKAVVLDRHVQKEIRDIREHQTSGPVYNIVANQNAGQMNTHGHRTASLPDDVIQEMVLNHEAVNERFQRQTLPSINEALSDVRGSAQANKEAIAQQGSDLTAVGARVTTTEQVLSQHTAVLNNMQQANGRTQSRITEAQNKADGNSQEIGRVRTEIQTVRGDVDAVASTTRMIEKQQAKAAKKVDHQAGVTASQDQAIIANAEAIADTQQTAASQLQLINDVQAQSEGNADVIAKVANQNAKQAKRIAGMQERAGEQSQLVEEAHMTANTALSEAGIAHAAAEDAKFLAQTNQQAIEDNAHAQDATAEATYRNIKRVERQSKKVTHQGTAIRQAQQAAQATQQGGLVRDMALASGVDQNAQGIELVNEQVEFQGEVMRQMVVGGREAIKTQKAQGKKSTHQATVTRQNAQRIANLENRASVQAARSASEVKKLASRVKDNNKMARENWDAVEENIAVIDKNWNAIEDNITSIRSNSQHVSSNRTAINHNSQAIAKNSQDIASLRQDFEKMADEMNGVKAQAGAFAGLVQPYGVGHINTTVALGHSGSESAIAAGIGYRVTEQLTIKAGLGYETVASSTTEYVGVGYEW
ncbi:YadA-like family protein [Vibrio sp. SCSIO 43140]|uniref:YadA-like family protein n=1 Tax=Vibrio sp. SCSIO 43140 TaxID=2819100 RepID=UPI0020760119|nr:YadA-like family protein [Vibrio sp. SCSIO 43140]USD58815.1 YadA-like family protein [Vibrio sp. SCSIO 43140]USD59149.1 YadA-like family protein [Vibrio sp. SCSIO 43140]USD59698.1 YadA-like family protein [Vibrio sp. SCSIO 43140]